MMKRFSILLFLCCLIGFAGTAAALDADFSGEYYAEGVINSNVNLNDNDATDQFRQMRLRLKGDFVVTESLTLTTRFDALEKTWSSKDSAFDNNSDQENIDFDRAYVSIKTPIGLFVVGRQQGVVWGTSWADDEADTDRIKYILPLPMGEDKLYLAAVAEKVTELDAGPEVSDADNDKYYLSGTYVSQNWRFGLLGGFYNFKTFQDPGQVLASNTFRDVYGTTDLASAVTDYGALLTGYGTALFLDGGTPGANVGAFVAANPEFPALNAQLGAPGVTGSAADTIINRRGALTIGKAYLISPYFVGNFGNFGFQAELDYVTGSTEYDRSATGYQEPDHDIEAYSYFAEASYNAGPVKFQAGYAHQTGDGDLNDTKETSMGFISPGVDWGKTFILGRGDSNAYGNPHHLQTSLANGVGNHVGGGFGTYSAALIDGFKMYYLGLDYKVLDNLTLSAIVAKSYADEVPANIDDDQGWEYNLSLSWDIMKNLEYWAVAAYLDAGDYWKQRAGIPADQFEDNYTLFHRLTLSF